MSEVCVVIPNYNGIQYIENCLMSLQLQDHKDFSIVVVDNASTDGSAELVKKNFPSVTLLERENNDGFSAAVNDGVQATDAPYVILLNNDTTVETDFVSRLVASIQKSKRVFSVGAKMLCMSDHNRIDDAGDFYTVLGWAFARGKNAPAHKYEKTTKVFSACAGAAIYRRDLLCGIGLFDELHFAYLEDLDVGYRAQIYGYTNMYEPTAKCYHAGSGSSGSRYNPFKVRLAAKNSIYVMYKNLTILQWILHFPYVILGILIKWFFFSGKKLGKEYIGGIREGFLTVKLQNVTEKRIHFRWKNCKNYWKIEWELWVNLFLLVLYR